MRLRSDARLVLLCPPGGALTRVEKKRLLVNDTIENRELARKAEEVALRERQLQD